MTKYKKIFLFILLVSIIFLWKIIQKNSERSTHHNIDKKGYTVMEQTTLSKKEIYTTGILDFLKKKKLVYEKLWNYRYVEMGTPNMITYKPIGYYVLNITDLNDWYQKFILKYDPTDTHSIEKILFNEFNATKIENPSNYLEIDDTLTSAGMKNVFLISDGNGGWALYLRDSFELKEKNNKLSILERCIYIFKEENIDWIKNDVKAYHEHTIGSYYLFEVDNYGNANYDIEEVLEAKINI